MVLNVTVLRFRQESNSFLRSLGTLLRSDVTIMRDGRGSEMVYPVPLLSSGAARRKRSLSFDATKVYLQLDVTNCKASGGPCFDRPSAAAQFVSVAIKQRTFASPYPVWEINAQDGPEPSPPAPTRDPQQLVIGLVATALAVLVAVIGVLSYRAVQTRRDGQKTVHTTDTWYPEGMVPPGIVSCPDACVGSGVGTVGGRLANRSETPTLSINSSLRRSESDTTESSCFRANTPDRLLLPPETSAGHHRSAAIAAAAAAVTAGNGPAAASRRYRIKVRGLRCFEGVYVGC